MNASPNAMNGDNDCELREVTIKVREIKPPSPRRFLLTCFGIAVTCCVAIYVFLVSAFQLQPPKVDFNLYIMAMSYQPEFCYQNREDDLPGCSHPREFWKSHLTIHGLWPDFADGGWPQFCTKEKLNNATISPILSQLEQYWPNVKALQPTSEHFLESWQHEWSKHGTCTGLTQKEYFQAALNNFVETPNLIAQNYGGRVNKSDLLKSYGIETVLHCSNKEWLSEVWICLGVSDTGEPLQRVACPKSAGEDNTCESEEIRIAKFPGSEWVSFESLLHSNVNVA